MGFYLSKHWEWTILPGINFAQIVCMDKLQWQLKVFLEKIAMKTISSNAWSQPFKIQYTNFQHTSTLLDSRLLLKCQWWHSIPQRCWFTVSWFHVDVWNEQQMMTLWSCIYIFFLCNLSVKICVHWRRPTLWKILQTYNLCQMLKNLTAYYFAKGFP